ncbi:MAG: hypothetical protein JXR83_02910 [Deltaproteobacteria bacterium]|nr:hypothetical protein [Deltaproteobacteria bacterium]
MAVPLIDVISPLVTCALVIVLPCILACWVIYRTVTEKRGPAVPVAEPEGPTFANAVEVLSTAESLSDDYGKSPTGDRPPEK